VDDNTDLLVNLTNDGWFGESAAQWQQAATATFRAVENGVPLLRCCNNGLTCWVDQFGRVQEVFRDTNGSEYGPGFAYWKIRYPSAEQRGAGTWYRRHGDRFGWSCAGITAALLLWRSKPARKDSARHNR
jgi:apolipoprotein N-acyltransferase